MASSESNILHKFSQPRPLQGDPCEGASKNGITLGKAEKNLRFNLRFIPKHYCESRTLRNVRDSEQCSGDLVVLMHVV